MVYSRRATGASDNAKFSSGGAQATRAAFHAEKRPSVPSSASAAYCQHVGVPYAQQLASKDTRVAELFADVADVRVAATILAWTSRTTIATRWCPHAPGRKLQAPRERSGGGRRDGRAAAATASAPRSRAARSSAACTRPDRTASSPPTAVSSENEEAKRIIRTVRDHAALRYRAVPRGFRHGLLRHAVVRVDIPAARSWSRWSRTAALSRIARVLSRAGAPLPSHHVGRAERERAPDQRILGEREQTLYGPGFILDKLCGLSFRISSQSFYQVNAVQTEVLYERAIDLAGFHRL